MASSVTTLLLVFAIAAVAPVLADGVSRWVAVPLVVFEIVLGLVLGPAVLRWMTPDASVGLLAEFGLAALFFLAGLEIDFARVGGRVLRRSLLGWVLALAVATGIGMALARNVNAGVYIGVALTSTALGTIMPVLRDTGDLRTPFGTAVTGIGAVGEFGPLIAISLFLSGRRPGSAAVVLLAFVVVATVAIVLSARGSYRGLHRLIGMTLHTSGQFAVRLVVVVLAALVTLSIALRLDMLLGAFTAGVVVGLLLDGATEEDRHAVESKIEAVGFGFLVPVFFVATGLRFDLAALTGSPTALLLLVGFAVLLLLVRGLSGLFSTPSGASPADRRAIVLLSATGLPIIVAVTMIGTTSGDLPRPVASALVGAGMLSVLLFPILAMGQRQRSGAATSPSRPVPDEQIQEEA
jgi:Kef-type K+ transport system membrane component KefB